MKRLLLALLLLPSLAWAQKPPINSVAGPTTSAQLESIITDASGTGLLLFGLSSATTINGVSCVIGTSCFVPASATNVAPGFTTVAPNTNPSGLFFNSSGILNVLATIANGVLVTSPSGIPSISMTLPNGLAMGTPFTLNLTNATGLPNSGLVNSSVTINGNSVSLGGSTTITAAATSIAPGTTTVSPNTHPSGLLYNAAGIANVLATANSGVLITSGAGVPSISTTLPSGLTIGNNLSIAGGSATFNLLNISISLTGNPPGGGFLSSFTGANIQGVTSNAGNSESMLAVGLTSNLGSGVGSGNGNKLGIYSGIVGMSGTGDIWAFNTVTTQSASSGTYTAHGYENDCNNYNQDLLTATATPTGLPTNYFTCNGVTGVSGAGTFYGTFGYTIEGGNWQHGFAAFGNVRDNSFYEFTTSTYGLNLQGTHTYGIFVNSSAALNIFNGPIGANLQGNSITAGNSLDIGSGVDNRLRIAGPVTLATGSSIFSGNDADNAERALEFGATQFLFSGGPVGAAVYFVNSSGFPALNPCGSSPVIDSNSTNQSGTLTTGTGTPTVCTLTFTTAYPTAAQCSITPANAAANGVSGGTYISSQNSAGFTITLGTGTSSAAYNYVCFGK